MIVAAVTIFGFTLIELIAVVTVAGYVISQFRDFRPVRQLRRENGELRDLLKSAQNHIGELEQRVHDLEKQTVPVLQKEIVAMARILERVGERLSDLDGTVAKNTAAVEFLSKRALLDEALDEHEGRT